jgi:hypothetical protein
MSRSIGPRTVAAIRAHSQISSTVVSNRLSDTGTLRDAKVTSSHGEGIRPSTSGHYIRPNLLPARRAPSSQALMRRRTTEQKIAKLKTQIDANLSTSLAFD